MRNWARTLAAVAIAAMLALPFLPSMKAGDSQNELVLEIFGTPPNVEFYDVAWRPDGQAAYFVGYSSTTGRGCVYWYDPSKLGATAWTENLVGGISNPTANAIRVVEWDPINNRFYAVGNGTTIEGYTYTDISPAGAMDEGSNSQFAYLTPEKMIWDAPNGRMLMVGYNPMMGGGVCWQYAAGPDIWTKLFDTGNTKEVLKGVAIDPSSQDIFVVGSNKVFGCGLYYRWSSGLTLLNNSQWVYFSDIAYANGQMIIGADLTTYQTQMLYCADQGSGFGTLVGLLKDSTNEDMVTDLAVDSNGMVVGVGADRIDGTGRVYNLWKDASLVWHAAQRSDTSTVYLNHPFYSVSIRPAGAPFALISGSAFKYSYTSAVSNIEINAEWPHIGYIDLYDAGTTSSRLNSQVDADPGTATTNYDLTTRAWHEAGQANIARVDAYLWRDDGAVETRPAPFDMPGFGNLRMHFAWTRANLTHWQIYPTGAAPETELVPGSGFADWGDGKNVTVSFRFSPHQQVRWADASPGFNQPAGTRYGGGVDEGQSTAAALDDLNSWNIEVVVTDTGAAAESAFDEFGTYRYTYIGVEGLPGGGSIQGAGPPNTAALLSPWNQDVTYSSNSPYQLSVACTDLTGVNLAGTIPVGDLSVKGGQQAGYVNFTGPGLPTPLVGVPVSVASLDWGRVTTTSSWDSNPGTNEWVSYMCWIPNVPEDYYLGTLTYTLIHV